MQTPQFNEKKTTQLAAAFIERSGGTLNYMKLIKLMYMADRAALISWERSITGDAYLAMKHGPVLGNTYSMIADGQSPSENGFWFDYIARNGNYDVSLAKPCPPSNLSDVEKKVVDEVFEEYGHYEKWQLVDLLHEILPEWRDPGGSVFPIYVRDILQGAGSSAEQAAKVEADLAHLQEAKVLLGCS
jgi:uncharacterized phage-associated protein